MQAMLTSPHFSPNFITELTGGISLPELNYFLTKHTTTPTFLSHTTHSPLSLQVQTSTPLIQPPSSSLPLPPKATPRCSNHHCHSSSSLPTDTMGRTTKQSSSVSFWSSRRRASSAPATPRPEPAPDPPIGCMSMVHYLIFAPGAGCVGRPPASSNAIVAPHGADSQSGLDDDNRREGRTSKSSGFEAPRNSLDLDADNPNDIQIGVQIEPAFDALARTNMRRPKPTAPSSEAETPRTPSLVARLMGIDGLPDQLPSPSPGHHHKTTRPPSSTSSNKENTAHCSSSAPGSAGGKGEKKKRVIPESMNRREPLRSLSCNVEARSLPDTPRGSTTSARASWDGPRLSLQALKESVLDRAAQYMSVPSSPTSSSAAAAGGRKKKKERERAAKEHAREILRQAKENVATRKSKSSSPAAEKKRHSCSFSDKENLMPTSPVAAAPVVEDKLVDVVQAAAAGKPTTVAAAKAHQVGAEHPPPSHNNNNNPRVPLAPRQQSPPPPQRAKPSRPPPPPPPLDPPTRAKRPDGCERFATRIKKPAAVAAGAQPPPPPASPPVAMPTPSSAPATTKPSALSSERALHAPSSSVPVEEDPEYRYLRTVLERGGFMRSPPRRPWRPYAAASPVDPIVFHLLELELPADESHLGPLRHRWNRKLLFHLAQELLADLVPVPQQEYASSAVAGTERGVAPLTTLTGAPLLGKVWRKVRGFPAADCKVVGDIDALVAADLEESTGRRRRLAEHPAVAEEAGDVAEEVADGVLEALLGECVAESVSLSQS